MNEPLPKSAHRGDHARCQPCGSILAEMVYWLHDCGIPTLDATALAITSMVDRAYQGGIDQFLLDA